MDDLARGAEHFGWRAPDGTELPALSWSPRGGRALGNVLCIHGLDGSATDFGPLARELAGRGCAVRAPSLRGQGRDPDPARRGHFLDPGQWRDDLAAFCETFDHDVPLHVVGESMGALLAVNAVAHGALRPRRLVLAVPVTETRAAIPAWIVAAVQAGARMFPRLKLSPLRFVHGKRAIPRLTANDEYMEYLRDRPHRVGGFSLHFLARFHRLMEESRACAAKVRAPTLMLAAGRDVFIKPEQSRAFFEQLGAPEKEYLLYPESHHLLWHDVNAPDVLARITGWLLEERR